MDKCIQIWRAGCIIRSGYVGCLLIRLVYSALMPMFMQISDLIQPIYEADPKLPNLLLNEKICAEIQKTYEALKEVVLLGVQTDAVIPSISASLEYIKSVACDDPTNFEEAQLDAFGDHMYVQLAHVCTFADSLLQVRLDQGEQAATQEGRSSRRMEESIEHCFAPFPS